MVYLPEGRQPGPGWRRMFIDPRTKSMSLVQNDGTKFAARLGLVPYGVDPENSSKSNCWKIR